jgi:hypothetical protein
VIPFDLAETYRGKGWSGSCFVSSASLICPLINALVPPAIDRRTTVTTIPPPELGHGITELLRLVGAVRPLAFDGTLPPAEALGRITDAFHDTGRAA